MATVIIVANLIVEGEKPATPSNERVCEDCGNACWVAKKQIMMPELTEKDIEEAEVVCLGCLAKRLEKEESK